MLLRAVTALSLTALPLHADPVKVVTDIPAVHSLTSSLMAGVGKPELLLRSGESPHDLALRPSQARNMQEADLIVWMGHGLSPQLEDPIETLGANADVLELLDLKGVELLEIRESAEFGDDHDHGHGDHDDHGDEEHAAKDDHDDHDHEEHAGEEDHDDHDHEEHASKDDHDDHDHEEHADKDDHDDHDHEEHASEEGHDDHDHEEHAEKDDHDEHAGHDHHAHGDGPDPHAWLDPKIAAYWADEIAEHLAEADPENASVYATNRDALKADLASLDAELAASLAPKQNTPFIMQHDALQYFEVAYGLNARGAVADSEDAPAGPARLRDVQAMLAEGEITCALTEAGTNPRSILAIAPKDTMTLVEIDLVGLSLSPGPALYADLLRGLAAGIVKCP